MSRGYSAGNWFNIFNPEKKIISLLVIKQNTFFTLLIFLLGEREVGTEGKLLLLAKEDGFLDAVDVHNRKKVMRVFEQNWEHIVFLNKIIFEYELFHSWEWQNPRWVLVFITLILLKKVTETITDCRHSLRGLFLMNNYLKYGIYILKSSAEPSVTRDFWTAVKPIWGGTVNM